MKPLITLLLLGWIPLACVKGQLPSVDLSKLAQYRPDTLYYPFYNEVQMIVIDHVGPWTRKMASQSMRAKDYTHLPSPEPNVYLFRHVSGMMVAAYNTNDSLAQWTGRFKGKPLAPPSGPEQYRWLPRHILLGTLHHHYADYSPHFVDGHYLIYGDVIPVKEILPRKEKGSDFSNYRYRLVGLIDSSGIVLVPPVYRQILPVGNQLLVQKKQGEWGIMNKYLRTIVPFAYDDYKAGRQGLRDYYELIKNKQTCALYNIHTAQLTPINCYDDVYGSGDSRNNNVIVVRREGKIGFMSKQFVETVSPRYEVLESFYQYNERLYRVIRDGKAGFVDTWGQEVIPCVYEHVERFEAGKALVLYQGKWQYIDTAGQVLPLAAGKPDWKYEYAHGTDFKIVKHHFFVEWYGLVNARTDSLVVPLRYRRIELRPMEHFFRVSKNDKQGIIDLKGQLVLPCEYDTIYEFYKGNGMAVVRKNDKYGIINRNFVAIVPCKYELLRHDGTGHLINKLNGKEGLMDTLGRSIIPNRYDWLGGFNMLHVKWPNSFARVRLNERYGYINLQGREVVPVEYDEVGEASNAIIGVKKAGKWGFVDTTGQLLTPFVYDGIDYGFSRVYGKIYVKVYKGIKSGMVNERGKEVVPCLYDAIIGYAKGMFIVKNGNKTENVQVVGQE